MWLQFAVCSLAFVAFLYIPGYIGAMAIMRDRFLALASAPLVTTAAYSLFAIVLGKLGIFTNWAWVFVPATLISLVCCLARTRRQANGAHLSNKIATSRKMDGQFTDELQAYIPYIAVGLLVCLLYFIKPLDGPTSFSYRTDDTYHLNLIWRFVKSGNWSTLHASLYEDLDKAAMSGPNYYPAGWHLLVAMVTQAIDVQPSLGANSVNAVLIGIVLPTSSYALIRTSLQDKPLAVRLGAIFPLAFGAFPWHIIIPEAKESFFYGIILAIACAAMIVRLCESLSDLDPAMLPGQIVLVLICLLACAFAQPSAVFSVGTLLIPLFVRTIWRILAKKGLMNRAHATLSAIGFLAFVFAVWTICYNVPAIHSITLFPHASFTSLRDAVVQVILLGFKSKPAQPLLALFVWTGVFYSVYRKRYRWISVGFLIFCALYAIGATTDTVLKNYLTGFWYNDYSRIAATACVLGIPLAALGLFAWVRVVQKIFTETASRKDDALKFSRSILPCTMALLSFAVVFYPNFTPPHQEEKTTTAFGYIASRARKYNSKWKSVLDAPELEFLGEGKDVVGDDLVINCPVDGSAFAYATNDINVYYRRYNFEFANPDAQTIARRLDDIATDTEVQSIVEDLNARYVLMLDEGFGNGATYYWHYNAQTWSGFAGITDQTPGLEPVLAKGDMRLFRIVGLESN